MEATVTEEEVFYTYKPLETGSTQCHTGLPVEAPGPMRRQGVRGNVGKNFSCGFRGEEWAWQGEPI